MGNPNSFSLFTLILLLVSITLTFGSPAPSKLKSLLTKSGTTASTPTTEKADAFTLPTLYNTTRLTDCVLRDPNLIRFYVANNISNSSAYTEIQLNDTSSLANSGLDPKLPLKVLIHGYNQNISSEFPQNVKNAYLAAQNSLDKNILIVDYGALGNPGIPYRSLGSADTMICYAQAAYNVDRAAKRVAELIQFLINQEYTTLPQVHLIGHSLGCHVTGGAGNYLQQFFNGTKVARFSALDPAAPGFRPQLPGLRTMTKYDADRVDVIHTDQAFFGVLGPIGKVDFFMNFGLFLSPECVDFSSFKGFVGETVPDALTLGSWCSHLASTVYFSRSISENMTAIGVNSNATVGEFLNPSTPEGLYLYYESYLSGGSDTNSTTS